MRASTVRAVARTSRQAIVVGALLAGALAPSAARADNAEPPHSAELDAAIVRAAKLHGVPERLVRRVVMRESRYNPRARNHSFWGLMQISYPTARSMGFKGTPQELLNPVTNLTYAVPYLANAFIAAGKREDAAIRLYAHGYYDAARHRGLLGALRTADSAPAPGFHEEQVATAQPADSFFGWFGTSEASPDAQPAPPAQAVAEPAGVVVPTAGEALANKNALRRGRGEADTAGGIPAKWRHDGGTTILARGEQSADRFAANAAAGPAARRRAGHSRKTSEFASLDAPPQAAQAYSAVNGSEAAATPPQLAISQAIAQDGAAAPADPAAAPDAEGAKTSHRKSAAKRRIATKAKRLGAVAELKP